MDLFDEATVRGFAERYVRILAAVVSDSRVPVGDLEILDSVERELVVDRWPGRGVGAVGAVTLVELFDERVAVAGDATAVVFGDERVSYAELAARSRRLARHLIDVGVGPESLVGVALPRSVDLVVALLAVVQAGGAYVPLDPSYPADRLAYVVEDSAPTCVVSWSGREVDFGAGVRVVEVDRVDLGQVSSDVIVASERRGALVPESVAYVIYTSGSTGRPKGVLVPHRNVVRLLADTESVYGFGGDDVWTMFHSYAFDFSVWELWGALLYGGTLVVVDYFTSRSPQQFLELLERERVTVLNQTPSAFYQLAEVDRTAAAAPELALRYVIFGGEALELRRLLPWFERRGDRVPQLVNMYGITETTVHVSHRRIDEVTARTAVGSVVGEAISGLRVFVLDRRLRPVPAGVAGELYVAGGQLARGYHGRPSLTAARFVADPFAADGSLLYRTGDVARWDRRGELEYLGRADDQVKVRGFRIELGEIEAAVLADGSVAQVAVVVREDTPGDQRIVAYVVAAEGVDVDPEGLRAHVSEQLPDYMVPSAFVVLTEIPLTVNGKLDRRALPAPVFAVREFRAPVTPVEEIVAQVFGDVLEVARVGVDDDFFELGGNSLLATKVVARIGAALDTDVPVRMFFEASTVGSLAAALESQVGSGARAALVAQQRPEHVPLSLAQTRMWFLNRFDTESTAYNIPMALRLRGQVDVAVLAEAVGDVFARHESLRTVYPETVDGPAQRILPVPSVSLEAVTVSVEELERKLVELVTTRFDVTSQIPVRLELFRLAEGEFVLGAVVHHISADGSSMVPFARDLMLAYTARSAGAAPAWEPLAVQYADYALWQRRV
ncbi:amino acid adenylation domain-containing protein, partial [Rhodococcus sp. CH91]|uniref:amino acid adenylation domain-containing protein n=1 Tax=Rhodococcus sp. CH91 TaxID=2910256 RepID=UPI0027E0B962